MQGPLAIAIPGEVAGYWDAKERYGNPDMTWSRIVQPTVDMCRQGIPVSASLAAALAPKNYTDPGMISVFVNPDTGKVWTEGDMYTNPALADTLEMMAGAGDDGADMFYTGEIATKIIADLREQGKLFISIECK